MRNGKGQFIKGNKLSVDEEKKRIVSLRLAYSSGRRQPSKYWLGKKLSKDHRRKLSIGLLGKRKSEEHRMRIVESMKALWKQPEYRKMMVGKQSGKKHSLEHIRKRVVHYTGDKNWNWKGGITPLVRKVRNCWKMQKWKKLCRERDNNQCIICGETRKLVVDHIIPFSQIMEKYKIKDYQIAMMCEELWNIDNGRTLCNKHHVELQAPYHRVYEKRNI